VDEGAYGIPEPHIDNLWGIYVSKRFIGLNMG
jgi:hypothetical protein